MAIRVLIRKPGDTDMSTFPPATTFASVTVACLQRAAQACARNDVTDVWLWDDAAGVAGVVVLKSAGLGRDP